VRFIAAKYCVANHSHRWLRAKLDYIESSLAFYGFIVCSESFDGASENRSCMTHRTTHTFEDICGTVLNITTTEAAAAATIDATTSTGVGMEDGGNSSSSSLGSSSSNSSSSSSNDSDMDDVSTGEDTDECTKRRYAADHLPWKMKAAYDHPSMEGVIIVPTGDMPHSLKKMRNAMDLSGKDKSARNLHLNGLPISLKMAHDVYKKTPDANSSSTLMLYPKLNMNVFQPTSKTAMRTCDAARAQGQTMMDMLMEYGHLNENAGRTTYDSYIYHCRQTDKWVDVLNATWKKGCEPISSAYHRHVYDLCDYVMYLTKWKEQVGSNKNEFFPASTYEDVCYTSLGVVILAIYYLPKHPDHVLLQSRLGSDPCESTFMMKRNANANADKKGTDEIMSTLHGGPLMVLGASRKSNVENKKVYVGAELTLGKIKRSRDNQNDESE
jgi:hypothetical protein